MIHPVRVCKGAGVVAQDAADPNRRPVVNVCVLALFLALPGCRRDVAGDFVNRLQDESLEIRKDAAAELMVSPCVDSVVISALTNNLLADDDELSRLAAKALGQMRSMSAEETSNALDGLAHLLDHSNQDVQNVAAINMLRIDPEQRLARENVLAAIRRGAPLLSLEVGKLQPKAQWAVPTLKELAGRGDERTRQLARRVLADINAGEGTSP